jgi:hypothetical protein
MVPGEQDNAASLFIDRQKVNGGRVLLLVFPYPLIPKRYSLIA